MAKGIDLETIVDFIYDEDTDTPKTIWKIGAIDSAALVTLLRNAEVTAAGSLNLVRFGLKGFQNFVDSEGKTIVFATEEKTANGSVYRVAASDIIRRIPLPYILAIGTRILEISVKQ